MRTNPGQGAEGHFHPGQESLYELGLSMCFVRVRTVTEPLSLPSSAVGKGKQAASAPGSIGCKSGSKHNFRAYEN